MTERERIKLAVRKLGERGKNKMSDECELFYEDEVFCGACGGMHNPWEEDCPLEDDSLEWDEEFEE